MEKDTYTTPVMFRKFKEGDIVAIFPEQPGTNELSTCGCYQHIGQHGSASIFIERYTKPSKPEEYAELMQELEGIGYNLKIYKRWQGKFDHNRAKELAR